MEPWGIDDIIEKLNLNEHSIFIDLGTNLGQEIEKLLPLGVESHSFEPHPRLAEKVRQKYGDYDNLIFYEQAAWIKNEKRQFYFKRGIDAVNGGATLKRSKININVTDFIEVECIDISEYIKNLQRQIDVLKIDTEGSEYDILEHLINSSVIDSIDHIFAEDHGRKMNDSQYFSKREWVLKELAKRDKVLNKWL